MHPSHRLTTAAIAEATDRPGTLPHSLSIISERLENYRPPEEPFDPAGEWEHHYVMWIALRGNAGKSWEAGSLTIRRRLNEDSSSTLDINQVDWLPGVKRTSCTKAIATCAPDSLSTPQSWEIESEIRDIAGKPVDHTHLRVTGELARGRMIRRGQIERRMKAPKSFTSNWSLFDAVQRLPFSTKPLFFDLLEDLELLKPDHRLAYRQSLELELGGRVIRLRSFEQIGEGILPYTYWLDDQHRLLFAVGGLRTFLFDPTPEEPS